MTDHKTADAQHDLTQGSVPVPVRSAAKSAARAACLIALGAALPVFVSSITLGPSSRAKARFAVVDLASVVRKNQEAAVSLLAGGAADQRARDAALASAQGFGKRLDAEVVALSRECGCVLLMREAVIAGEVEDLTPALLSRLTKH